MTIGAEALLIKVFPWLAGASAAGTTGIGAWVWYDRKRRDKRLDDLEVETNSNSNRVGILDERLENTREDVKEVRKKVDNISDKINKVYLEICEQNGEIKNLSTKIDILIKDK